MPGQSQKGEGEKHETSSKLQSINPTTGEVIREFNLLTDVELELKLRKADEAYQQYRTTSFAQRAEMMMRVADLLEKNAEKYGKTLTLEMGKTYKQAISESKKCAKWAKYYAENAAKLLADEPVETSDAGKKGYIMYDSLGVILQIAPFNFPFLQVIRFATAALMAGNCALVRHSHSVTMSAMHLEEIFIEAGFPDGVFQILLASKDQVSRVIADARVKGVAITGSVEAGKKVAEQSGHQLKRQVMELGGSDAYIICDDADLDKAAKECVQGRVVNNGESCTAAKRFIVHEGVYDQFCSKIVEEMKKLKMGDPMNEDTDVGPLSRKDLRDTVHEGVEKSIKEGAKLLIGGQIPKDMQGFFYPPTILADVTPNNFAFNQEIFGPVAAVIKAKDENDAIRLANLSRFGLGGGVFSKDEAKGEKIARQMESGMVFVNRIVTSNPDYPFGGVKDSGYGRECGSAGIKEWVNVKTIIIK